MSFDFYQVLILFCSVRENLIALNDWSGQAKNFSIVFHPKNNREETEISISSFQSSRRSMREKSVKWKMSKPRNGRKGIDRFLGQIKIQNNFLKAPKRIVQLIFHSTTLPILRNHIALFYLGSNLRRKTWQTPPRWKWEEHL